MMDELDLVDEMEWEDSDKVTFVTLEKAGKENKMLVQDRVTGQWYDPEEEFKKLMESQAVRETMERLKNM